MALAGLPYFRANALIHLTYVRLLLVPYPLSVDYSFDCLRLEETGADPRLLAAVALYTAIVLGLLTSLSPLGAMAAPAACAWRRRPHASADMSLGRGEGEGMRCGGVAQPRGAEAGVDVGFGEGMEGRGAEQPGGREAGRGLGWLLVVAPMVPASNIFFIVGTTVAERLLYLPSVPYFTATLPCVSATLRYVSATLPYGSATLPCLTATLRYCCRTSTLPYLYLSATATATATARALPQPYCTCTLSPRPAPRCSSHTPAHASSPRALTHASPPPASEPVLPTAVTAKATATVI